MTSTNDDHNTTQAARPASELDPAQRLSDWLEADGGFGTVFKIITLCRPPPKPFKSRRAFVEFMEAKLYAMPDLPPEEIMPIEGLSPVEVVRIFTDWLHGTELYVLFHVNMTLNMFASSKL